MSCDDVERCPGCHMPVTEHCDPGCEEECRRCKKITSVVPDLLEVRVVDRSPRLFIDGHLFPYGTVEGTTVGPFSRNSAPSVTLRIVGMRIKVDVGVTDA